jgi:hypothetical protein
MCKTDYDYETTGFTCTCNLLPCVCTTEWSGGSMKAETEFAELYPEPTEMECECTCGLLPCICSNQWSGASEDPENAIVNEPPTAPQSPRSEMKSNASQSLDKSVNT